MTRLEVHMLWMYSVEMVSVLYRFYSTCSWISYEIRCLNLLEGGITVISTYIYFRKHTQHAVSYLHSDLFFIFAKAMQHLVLYNRQVKELRKLPSHINLCIYSLSPCNSAIMHLQMMLYVDYEAGGNICISFHCTKSITCSISVD